MITVKLYTKNDLIEYMKDDWIAKDLNNYGDGGIEETIRTNQWLKEMPNKRMIYADVYGDLLSDKNEFSVLDVGGGYNSLTKVLAKNCNYTLLDYMAHGSKEIYEKLCYIHQINWMNGDWYHFDPQSNYDIIISNDLFPDVDQRLELFLHKYLPLCYEMRLVITFYNTPKFYVTQREDDTEKLTYLSWDGEITGMKLKKFLENILETTETDLAGLSSFNESIFNNGRQVAYFLLKGRRKKRGL